MKNSTPDFVYVQAYEKFARDRVNLRVRPREVGKVYGTPTMTCDGGLNLPMPRPSQQLVMTFQGRYLKASVRTVGQQRPARHGRGIVTDFSAGSRGRLFDLFNKMNLKRKITFITLTYEGLTTDADMGKAQLRAFCKRLQRRYPSSALSFVWRLEFQKRGAIHFHILAFGLPFVPKEDIQRVWGECSCQSRPFTRIEAIFSQKKIMGYVGKYVAKVNHEEETGFNLVTYLSAYQEMHGMGIGRVWGVIGRENLPVEEAFIVELPFILEKFLKFRLAAANQYPPLYNSISMGFKLYVLSAEMWHTWFDAIYIFSN